MAERKLNLNTPLMSVRRNSLRASPNLNKKRISVDSLPNKRRSVAQNSVDYKLDQVTEPVAVPFMWEQIPGRAKDGSESEVDTPEETSSTPRMALGMVLDIRRKSLKRESADKARTNQDVSDELAIELKNFRGENNEKGEALIQGNQDEDDGDVYSDAVEALSSTESMTFSCNYSVSSLSGSEGPIVKPSGTFSVDPQTRDFMMKRFLPAARAMAVEPPQYTPKKQLAVVEQQPKKANEIILFKDPKPAPKQYSSEIVQHYTQQDKFDEESEDEDDDHDDFRTLSAKGCGLLPRLCLKGPLGLLNSVHDGKSRTRSSTPCAPRVRNPCRDTKRSQSQPKERCRSEVASPKLRGLENKPLSRSTSPLARSNRFNYSGELQQKGRLSPFRRTGNDGLAYPRIIGPVSRSGEIGHLGLPRLDPVRTSKNLSGELQTKVRLSPFRRTGNDGLSYPRSVGPISHSGEIGHLGLPKLDTIRTSKNLLAVGASNFERASPYLQRAKQCSGSSSPVVEKTLYVDTVNTARKSCSNVRSSGREAWMDAVGEEAFKGRGSGKLSARVSSFQDVKCLDISNVKSSTSPISFASVDTKDFTRQDQRFDEEFKSLVCMGQKNRNEGSKICDQTVDDEENMKIIPIETPLPPPLLKSPTESWLFRALPSISMKNSSYFSNSLYSKKQDSKVPPNNTKWETIVKSSKLHHDHVRYSEELVTHALQRPGS